MSLSRRLFLRNSFTGAAALPLLMSLDIDYCEARNIQLLARRARGDPWRMRGPVRFLGAGLDPAQRPSLAPL